MKRLTSLDLWATKIHEADLDLLANLPNLNYLSIGGVGGDRTFNTTTLLPRLQAVRSLERIWLDGVHVSEDGSRRGRRSRPTRSDPCWRESGESLSRQVAANAIFGAGRFP
jgi:hypothetical protein